MHNRRKHSEAEQNDKTFIFSPQGYFTNKAHILLTSRKPVFDQPGAYKTNPSLGTTRPFTVSTTPKPKLGHQVDPKFLNNAYLFDQGRYRNGPGKTRTTPYPQKKFTQQRPQSILPIGPSRSPPLRRQPQPQPPRLVNPGSFLTNPFTQLMSPITSLLQKTPWFKTSHQTNAQPKIHHSHPHIQALPRPNSVVPGNNNNPLFPQQNGRRRPSNSQAKKKLQSHNGRDPAIPLIGE